MLSYDLWSKLDITYKFSLFTLTLLDVYVYQTTAVIPTNIGFYLNKISSTYDPRLC